MGPISWLYTFLETNIIAGQTTFNLDTNQTKSKFILPRDSNMLRTLSLTSLFRLPNIVFFSVHWCWNVSLHTFHLRYHLKKPWNKVCFIRQRKFFLSKNPLTCLASRTCAAVWDRACLYLRCLPLNEHLIVLLSYVDTIYIPYCPVSLIGGALSLGECEYIIFYFIRVYGALLI